MLLLFTALLVAVSAQNAAAQPKPGTTLTVQALEFDGAIVGFVRSVKGGLVVADAVTDAGGKGGTVKKHPSPSRVDPLVFDIEPGGIEKALADWLASALNGTHKGRNAALVAYDPSFKEVTRRVFTNLRVTQIEFPGLDASSKDVAYITVTAQADSSVPQKASGSASPPKTKQTRVTNFKLTLDGLDTSRVSSISPITVKISDNRADASNFRVTFSQTSADEWEKWHETFIVKGSGTDANEKKGQIELLDATMKNPIMLLRVEGVGILRLSPADSVLDGKTTIRRIEAELYVETVRFEVK